MPFSSLIDLNILRSLRYSTGIGATPSDGSLAFPVNGVATTGFVAGEQAFELVATGLKPATVHRAYLNGVDVTQWCAQVGRGLGAGLVSTAPGAAIYVPMPGSIPFVFYYRPEIEALTAVQQSAAEASLVGGQRVLQIRSADGKSVAEVAFTLPQYARNEPDVQIKKTPIEEGQPLQAQTIVTQRNSTNETYYTTTNFSLVQTFYADPESVSGSGEVNLTSIDLFFRQKPSATSNVSGNQRPGVVVALCEVENNQPILSKTLNNSRVYMNYDMVFSYGDASTPVTFGFRQPVKIKTGKFYGIVVTFEDPGYQLWQNRVGDRLVGTNIPSPGSNLNKDGKLFLRNNAGVFNDLSDTSLKFVINSARFTAQNETKLFINNDYEFLTVEPISGRFIGGEYVYQNKTPEPGLVSTVAGSRIVNGNGTNFTPILQDQAIVIRTGNNITDSAHITTVTNVVNTSVIEVALPAPFTSTSAVAISTVIGKVAWQDINTKAITLSNSTANSMVFATGQTIVGGASVASGTISQINNLSVDRLRIKGDLDVPSAGRVKTTITGAQLVPGTGFVYNTTPVEVNINSSITTPAIDKDLYILSRSNEVTNSNLYSNNSLQIVRKSFVAKVDYTVDPSQPFQTPRVGGGQMTLFSLTNKVANTTNVPSTDSLGRPIAIDSEISGNGSALSRHIGKRVTFARGRKAEDIRVIMTAYRPRGSDIKIYARVHNSADNETMEDKSWTPLQYVENAQNFSSSENENDFIEYQLGFGSYPEAANTLPITFNVTVGQSAIAVADSTRLNPSQWVTAGDVVRIYNPIAPETNYDLVPVQSANATHIILERPIEDTSIEGAGNVVETVKYKYVCFKNAQNDGIARYFNNELVAFDGFDTMQVKLVFVADNAYNSPRVDQIQVIGVSA